MENPLVSICIITYNSSEFISETLESVKNQTYKNIELIISDDCSTDDTVEVCTNWIKNNKNRFFRTEIVIPPKNTGVAGNCNRAVKSAQGEYIKLIAGDDLLTQDSIEKYQAFCENTKSDICFAKMKMFGSDIQSLTKTNTEFEYNYYPYLKMNITSQKKEILRRIFVPGPGLFYRRTIWEKVSKYDENYQFCEEYPFAYNILSQNIPILFIDDFLVLYRVRADSLCHGELGMNYRVFKDFRQYFLDHRRKNMLKNGLILDAWHQTIDLYRQNIIYKYGLGSLQSKLAYYLLFFSPLAYTYYYKIFKAKKRK